MEKPSIFISYSSKDRETAEIIHQKLESSGFDVWRDKSRLETDWSREIAQALADSDVLCLLWSEQAAQSKWVKHEWLTARALEKTIILCRLPDAPRSPEPLHNLQEVNLEELEKGSQDLISRLKDRQDFGEEYDYTVLPKNSYIPFNPNPNFTGRGQDLLELYLKLIGNLNKIGINQVGTVGMGGIGKTQLVVEFAYRFSFAFDSVYWIQAGDKGKWLDQFVELARDRLQLSINAESDKPEADKQYIYALQKYCKEKPDTLIIMDNVAEPMLLNNDSFLLGLTPLTLGCDLLFTTRKHFRLPGVSSQPVNILSKEGAYKLLTSYRKPHTPEDEKHASSICNGVGDLPLAIILAGAFLKKYQSEVSFEDYHEKLLKNRLATIDTDAISEEELAIRHKDAVTTTLESQWEVVKDEDARILFKLAGQFREAEIIRKARLGLLSGIGPRKSRIDQPLAKAFNLLQDLNLVEKLEGDASAIRLHPLVHDFAIRTVPQEEIASFKSKAAKNLKTAMFEYSCLQSELDKSGIRQLLSDMEIAIEWWGDETAGLRELEILHGALRLSFNHLLKRTDQLATQLLGRLMSPKVRGINKFRRWLMKSKTSAIDGLIEAAEKEKEGPWLRPLTPSLIPPGSSLLRTLEGHSGKVKAVAFAPDGNTVVSASWDKTLKVWDLRTGEVRQTLEGHSGWVTAVAISPDGDTALSASTDKTMKTWDLHTGEVQQTLEGHSDSVEAVAITPDGKTAVSASLDHTLKVWDLLAGEVSLSLESDTAFSEFAAVAITPDGKSAVSASSKCDGLTVWDLHTGEVRQTLEGDAGKVIGLAISSDGKTAVSVSADDFDVKVWNLCDNELPAEMVYVDHGDALTAVAIAPDGKTVVSASWDKTLKVWDLHTGEVRQTLEGHSEAVKGVAIAPDGKTVLSASWDKTLKVWDLRTGEARQTIEGHGKEVTAVVVAPDGKTAVSASSYGYRKLTVWDACTGEFLQTLKAYSSYLDTMAVAPDGKTVMSGLSDGSLIVWVLHSSEVRLRLQGHSEGVTAVAIASSGKTAVSASQDKTLKSWDLRTGQLLRTLKVRSGVINAVAIAPNGNTVVSASTEKTLKVWDLHTGQVCQTLEGHGSSVEAVAIAPDGRTAVSASRDNTLKVWNLRPSGTPKRASHLSYLLSRFHCFCKYFNLDNSHLTLEGHNERVTAVAIAPNGKTAVSASWDETLRVWDLCSGEESAGFYGDGRISAFCISPDGKLIVAGEESGRMHFLRIEGMS